MSPHKKQQTAEKAEKTTDHGIIRKWVEERGGHPATIKTSAAGEPTILRIDFPGYSGGETLLEITWEEFFETFEDNNLAFLHQDRTNTGEPSRFCKLVRR